MSRPGKPFTAPPIAEARVSRLCALLAAMEAAAPSREPASLAEFRQAMAEGSLDRAQDLVPLLEQEDFLEEAFGILREFRRTLLPSEALSRLTASLSRLAEQARSRRAAAWQLDARRTHIHFVYAKAGASLDFDTGDLQRIFLLAFRLEGLWPALDLGHHPRPMLQLGPALPAGVAGAEEWGEAVFRRPPGEPSALLTRLASRLPDGLRILRWEEQPAYATPLMERMETSCWIWSCPSDRLEEARLRVTRFLEADRFDWERPGKQDGQKQQKTVDLRPMVDTMAWDGALLRFTTPMRAFGATNPLKMLGAILGWEASDLRGLVREAILLAEDPRLAQAERFEPKLRNLYEDAVLLTGGSNITIIEDEDDEPLRLG